MLNPKINQLITQLAQFDAPTEPQLHLMNDWLTELVIFAILDKQKIEVSLKTPVAPIAPTNPDLIPL